MHDHEGTKSSKVFSDVITGIRLGSTDSHAHTLTCTRVPMQTQSAIKSQTSNKDLSLIEH